MSGADRMRRLRDRRRRGTVALLIEVDQVNLAEFLVAAGDLPARDGDDPAAIRAAVERWVNRATSPQAFEAVTASRRAISETGMIPKIA